MTALEAFPLRLASVRHEVFGGGKPYVREPGVLSYFSDMLGLYGRACREDWYARGNRNSFTEMSEALVHAMAPLGELDIIVVAHAVEDCDPRRSAASYLTYVCSGDPLAFAISDQGIAAPFTALRVVQGYARLGACRRALVIVLDQSTVPDDGGVLDASVRKDHAVGLLLQQEGPARFRGLRQRVDVAPEQVRDVLDLELTAFGSSEGAGRPVTVVLGEGLDPVLDLPPLRCGTKRAPRGQLCTAVWAALADGLPHWKATGQRVFAADYDPGLRSFCLLASDIAAPGGAAVDPAGKAPA